MDKTCTPKESASAETAETTTTKSKLGAWRSHKENHKKQRKKKDNTQKNMNNKIASDDGNNPSNVSWGTWHGARCGTAPIPIKKVVEGSLRMESRRNSHKQTSMRRMQRNQLYKVRFVIGWGKSFASLYIFLKFSHPIAFFLFPCSCSCSCSYPRLVLVVLHDKNRHDRGRLGRRPAPGVASLLRRRERHEQLLEVQQAGRSV